MNIISGLSVNQWNKYNTKGNIGRSMNLAILYNMVLLKQIMRSDIKSFGDFPPKGYSIHEESENHIQPTQNWMELVGNKFRSIILIQFEICREYKQILEEKSLEINKEMKDHTIIFPLTQHI